MALYMWSLLFLGTIFLYFGSEIFIKGTTRLALFYGMRPLFVGLWIIALGTAVPELMVGLNACFFRNSELAFGMVIGSNLANIGLVIGVAAMIRPIKIQVTMVRKELPCLLVGTILFAALGYDGALNIVDGVVLVTSFFIITFFLRTLASKNPRDEHELGREINPSSRGMVNHFFLFFSGFIALLMGGYLVVKGAFHFQSSLSATPYAVGIVLIALATSIPEFIIAIISSLKGHGDLSVGNAVSSSLFQILFVMGLIAMISPVENTTIHFRLDTMILCGFVLFLFLVQITTFRLNRLGGLALVFVYCLYFLTELLPRL